MGPNSLQAYSQTFDERFVSGSSSATAIAMAANAPVRLAAGRHHRPLAL